MWFCGLQAADCVTVRALAGGSVLLAGTSRFGRLFLKLLCLAYCKVGPAVLQFAGCILFYSSGTCTLQRVAGKCRLFSKLLLNFLGLAFYKVALAHVVAGSFGILSV